MPTDSPGTHRIELEDGIVLRPPTEADAETINDAVTESLGTLIPWMPWAANEPISVGSRRGLIRQWELEFTSGENRTFAMFDGSRAIGVLGLHRRIGPGGLELGYWIHPGWADRGITSRAAAALTLFAFGREDVDHVEIHHDPANPASGRVAEKAGYVKIAERPSPIDAPGETGFEWVWEARRGRWAAP